MDILLVNEDNKHGKSAAIKICKEARPGGLVFLSEKELLAVQNGHVMKYSMETAPKPYVVPSGIDLGKNVKEAHLEGR